MKILFVNPPIIDQPPGFHFNLNQPIGATQLCAILESAGHKASYVDAEALGMSPEKTLEVIKQVQPDALGVTVLSRNAESTKLLVNKIRGIMPDIYIALGGPQCSALKDKILEDTLADSVTVGEADGNIVNIFEQRTKGVINGIFPPDLDRLPLPLRTKALPPCNTYIGNEPRFESPEVSTLWTRGCPHIGCRFCSLPVFGKSPIRLRHPQNIVDELHQLKRDYGARHVFVYSDELFGGTPKQNKWLASVCELIIKNEVGVTWKTQGRCSQKDVEEDLLALAAKAGAVAVKWGNESMSQKVLDALNKRISPEDIVFTLRAAKRAGLKNYCFFMVGCLEETEEEYQKSLKGVRALYREGLIDWIQVTVMSAEPGSELYTMAQENGWLTTDKARVYHYDALLNLPWASRERINQRRNELALAGMGKF
jgi:radical SAM superfamily enzyme YgiQ (UPF0313 family)